MSVGIKSRLRQSLDEKDGKKAEIHSEEEVQQIISAIKGADFKVKDIKLSERSKKAPLPFTTSTLQQEASKRLNFSTQKTMRLAQQLYEGVDVKGMGTVGLITYLRTDSTRISEEAAEASKDYIMSAYGESYVSSSQKDGNANKKVQDAHEAIRPTYFTLPPVKVKESLARDQFRLYQLVWNRFLASRMSDAVYEITSVKIEAADYLFTLAASKVKFEGFLSVYKQEDDKDEKNVLSRS